MNAVIWILTFMTFTMVTLTQTGQLSRSFGYSVSGVMAAITVGLALVRYRGRKAEGQ